MSDQMKSIIRRDQYQAAREVMLRQCGNNFAGPPDADDRAWVKGRGHMPVLDALQTLGATPTATFCAALDYRRECKNQGDES